MEKIALFSPGIHIDPAKKESLWQISSAIHRKTLVFFALLILLATVLSGVAIYHNNKQEPAQTNNETVSGRTTATDAGTASDEAQTHRGIEDSLTIMTVAMAGILMLFMFFFIRDIIRPLSRLEKLTRKMADGRLDLLVQENRNAGCSISAIGENVNSLAMNLQEILLLVWNLSEHNIERVDRTIETLEGAGEIPRDLIRTDLAALKSELEQMQGLVRQFELFDVVLQEKKALARNDTTKS